MQKKIRETIQKLLTLPEVKKAFEAIEQDRQYILDRQIELAQIPAPSFHEKEKAERFAQFLEETGVGPVRMDDIFNVFAEMQGAGEGAPVMVSGHSDTVFPADTDLTMKILPDGAINIPGIADDTRGMAEVLSLARAVKAAGIRTSRSVIFAANVCEEGDGDFKGIQRICRDMPGLGAFLTLDGSAPGSIAYCGTGDNIYKVVMTGRGGHSFGSYGTPNPAHAAGRAIAKLADLKLPAKPKTTVNVGMMSGAAGPTAIPMEVSFTYDLRSNGPEELPYYDEICKKLIAEAVEEENARWESPHKIQCRIEPQSLCPAARQEEDAPILLTALEALKAVDMPYEPRPDGAGCTDANWAIYSGIPALALGRGGKSGGGHSVSEWFLPQDEHRAVQRDLLILLALAGVEGKTDPLLSAPGAKDLS